MRSFVKRAPISNGFTPVQVVDLSEQVLLNWLQQIQPVIRKSPDRLDRKWNWQYLYRYLPFIEQLNGRELAGYAVQIQNDEGNAVPSGLVLLSNGYPALDDHRERSVYLWFLTAAPKEALQNLKVSVKPRLLEILIDIAMVESERLGYYGRIGLHAADEVGNPEAQKLFESYQSRCCLLSLPQDVKMPSTARNLIEPNTGRYFYTTPLVAQDRMTALDYIR